MGGQQVFWTDDRFDRTHSRDSLGRYGEQIWRNLGEFDDSWGDIAPVEFACAAWRVAIPPVTSPGYVRWHRRILSASCVRNTWDGSLLARVSLVSKLPQALTGSRVWQRDRGWQDWAEVFGQFVEPTEQDLAKAPHLRATLMVDAPLPLDRLPTAPEGPDEHLVATAQRAVTVLVDELNELLVSVIAGLDGDLS